VFCTLYFLYIYINILIQSTLTTLSNTVHSNYFSRHTNTAKFFLKLKKKSYNIHKCNRLQFSCAGDKQTDRQTNISEVFPIFCYSHPTYVHMYGVHTYVYRYYRQCTVGQELTKNVPFKQTKLKSVILYICSTIRNNKYLLTLLIRQCDRIYIQS